MTASKSGSDSHRAIARIRLAGLAAALVGAVLSLVVGERINRPLFDVWQRGSQRDLSASQVRIVAIDSESLRLVGPWPWPRYHLARLTEKIAAQHPAAIGFDMLFPEPDRVRPDIFAGLYPELSPAAAVEIGGLESGDRLFARVISGAPVILGRAAVDRDGADPRSLIVDADVQGALPASLPSRSGVVANIAELEPVALGHGLLNGPPDDDGIVRRVPLLMRVGTRPMPGLALEMARSGLGLDRVTSGRHNVALGRSRAPVDDQGRMMLHFGTVPASHIISATEVLRRNFRPDMFTGKIVLIGHMAEGNADIVATPLAAESYGTLVQAQAIDAILRGGWLARSPWAPWVEWGEALLLAALVLAFVPRSRRGRLLVPLLAGAVISSSAWIAFAGFALLIDPLRPLMVGGATLAGVIAALFLENRREREGLRESLVRERVAAAATEGELQAARNIQLGMLPSRASLADIDPRVDIDALLEPARSVGGDFFDVVRLDADRIAFLIADVTGKGVPAALFMALSKALARSVMLRETADLAAAAFILNEEISRDNLDSMGVTMLIGLLDLISGAVMMVNAGHENPLLLHEGIVRHHPMEGGPPFCIVDYPWPAEPLTLAPGETLILITDGVTEAQNGHGALCGNDRTLAAAHAAPGNRAAAIVESMRAKVRAFEAGAEASDDLTIMAIRYIG
jgi:serine phosphatase RsbU (regulator of sigma subunit)/CHASE2 domain-containing sensor protein